MSVQKELCVQRFSGSKELGRCETTERRPLWLECSEAGEVSRSQCVTVTGLLLKAWHITTLTPRLSVEKEFSNYRAAERGDGRKPHIASLRSLGLEMLRGLEWADVWGSLIG